MELFTVACSLLVGIIIYAIFIIIKNHLERRHLYEKASKFSGPPCLPFIGNAYLFLGNTEAIMDKLNHLITVYGSLGRIWIGHHLMIHVSTPEQIKTVFTSQKTINKGELFDFARSWLGTGLFTASDAKWRVHRKLIQPSFNANILQSFVEVFSTQSRIMTEQIRGNLDGPEFNMYNYLTLYGLDSVCETSMGVSLGGQINGQSNYGEAVEQVIGGTIRRALSPWLHPDFIFYRTQLGRDQKKYIKFLHDFTDNVIRAKKKELLENNNLGPGSFSADNNNDECNTKNRRKAFLDHLIELSHDNETLNDQAIREEVDTIVVTATDSTSIMISFVMLMMASFPEVQEKVYQELCEIYGEDDNVEVNVTPDDLTRMNYLERVIKETMRLFPITPFLIRAVNDDLDLGCDHTLPKDSFAIIGVLDLHRNEKYWPDPLKFDPDRFLPEEVAKRHQYAYLAFSGGLRGCIGSKYAMMSMKTLLSTMLRKYVLKKDKIVPIKDIRLKMEFLVRPVIPIMLRIESRKRNIVSI